MISDPFRRCGYGDNSPLRPEFPPYPQRSRLRRHYQIPKGDISTLSIRGHFYFGLTGGHFYFGLTGVTGLYGRAFRKVRSHAWRMSSSALSGLASNKRRALATLR